MSADVLLPAGTVTAPRSGSDRPVLRMVREARGHWPALVLGAVFGALCVGAGVALLAVSGFLIARASEHPDEVALAVAVVGVRAFGIARGVFRYAERLVTHDAAFRSLVDLRVKVWNRLARAFPAGLPDVRSGDLVTRLVADVDAIQDLFIRGLTPPAVAAVVGGATVAAVTALLAPGGVVLLAGLLIGGVVVPLGCTWTARRAATATAADRGLLGAEVTDLVTGLPELIAYDAADTVLARLDDLDRRLLRTQRRWGWVSGLGAGATSLVTGVTVWGVLLAAVIAQSHGHATRVGTAVVVLAALAAFEVTQPLAAAAQQISAVRASARRITAVMDAPDAVREPAQPLPEAVLSDRPTIELRDLSYRYPGADRDAVSGLDLTLRPGERVALVGPSGAGKSMVAKLLLRLIEPTSGRYLIDGVDVHNFTGEQVRESVTAELADAHTFDSTLRDNLLLARPAATQDELDEAARAAKLADWITTQPMGWQTSVGPDGTELSGGERQRLGIARVLLAERPVVVVDEPTAHLDAATAAGVMSDLLAATAGRTLLVITHDPALLDRFDRVVRLHCSKPPKF